MRVWFYGNIRGDTRSSRTALSCRARSAGVRNRVAVGICRGQLSYPRIQAVDRYDATPVSLNASQGELAYGKPGRGRCLAPNTLVSRFISEISSRLPVKKTVVDKYNA